MGSFFRSNWLFVFIGFLVVLLAGLGYLIFQQIQTPETIVQPTEDGSEISFSLDQTTPAPLEIPSCISLTASPDKGMAPLSVTFQAEAIGTPGDTLTFIYSFGDNENKSVDQMVASSDGIAVQTVDHIYAESGNYTVFLTVEDTTTISRNVCETQVIVERVSDSQKTESSTSPTETILSSPTTTLLQITPSPTLDAITPTLTSTSDVGGPAPTESITSGTGDPTPTAVQIAQAATLTPTPTRRPTATPTPVEVFPTTIDDESIPVPDVPEAGGFAPTVVVLIGGAAIFLLAMLSKKVSI